MNFPVKERIEDAVNETKTFSQVREQLPRLVRSKKTIAILRAGHTEAFLVPRERMEMILETMELLANPKAMSAVRRDKSGTSRYLPLSALDENKG